MALNNITGNVKVWRNDYEVTKKVTKTYFNFSIGTKNEDGEWMNKSVEIRFSKKSNAEEILKNGDNIEIKHAWFGVKPVGDENEIYLFVNDFDLVKE